ncbi:putative ubiquitin hydrolase putativecysteine peptidase Clan CA family C19 [Leptomonas pyrrhocoris]|uniref:Ubiquitin carboxyl-terminal hydrolase n=1 Tax=Leptomonas pyrrhocoris TaxID=157538 RepID=A0A0M9G2Q7_LEPPY|nr:putative ubiquitin hydrolase putativecysteine peptidase Clan CA family C19 [Leptomonas pyrrhocoris]KPA80959.1 putative ubiquitin hydrolase putativecysteine peptidase Clan CA family C19 [Leptomonas pyrrhocoris]|eukprot:XP_015659398.1 putative ubiquitin hydrolase putativecysteine peptidase Clan CA family C19 [Leptomonas pyrrhocoris]
MFNFDYKVSYDEFVKTIYYHAWNYEIKAKEPQKEQQRQRVVVSELIKRAKLEESKQHYANAYYYANRCLLFFDTDKNNVDFGRNDPPRKKIFEEALDLEARLRQKDLLAEYNAMIEEIDRREPERCRIVAQQLEVDNNDVSPNAKPDSPGVNEHLARRQQLLSNESNNVNSLLQRLKATSGSRTQDSAAQIKLYPQNTSPSPAEPSAVATLSFPPPTYATLSPDIPLPPSPQPPLPYSGTRPVSPSSSSYAKCLLNSTNAAITVRRRGIVNLGNTCYMNSMLQVLNSTPLGQYFLTDDYVSQLVTRNGKLTRLINAFSFVIRELNRTDCDFSVSTSPFKLALGEYYEGFQNSRQQDANEFLRVVLDGVHGALNVNESNKVAFPEIDNTQGTDDELARRYWAQYYQTNSSVIVDYCAFQERSMIVCPSCNRQSRSFNVSLSIEIPIPHNSSRVSLEDCLAAYCGEEVLDNSSLYLCPSCKQKVNAKKQLLFYSAPPVLFVTLKRFRSYGDFSTASKVNTDVFFNKVLNMAPFMCSSFSKTKYHLVGIVNHQGNMHGGHYTADAIGPDGVWCNFSDERVTRSGEADNQLGYILCYVR